MQTAILNSRKDRYRFTFNGKETDNELKGQGNSLNFGARIYDPRVGRWLSIDPLASQFPSFGPYIAFADNPIKFIDPDGRDLDVAGEKGEAYLKSTLPDIPEVRAALTVSNEGKVSFDLSSLTEEQRADPAVQSLNTIINVSEKKYLLEVSTKAKGRTRVDGMVGVKIEVTLTAANPIENWSKTLHTEPGVENFEKGNLPKEGYDGQVTISPEVVFYDDEEGTVEKPIGSVVLHELNENYNRTDKGQYRRTVDPKDPDNAHNGSNAVEETLPEGHPAKSSNPGGAPVRKKK